MKSYIRVFDNEGREIDNFITDYKTLKGFLKYGVKDWIRNKKAVSFEFNTFSSSSDLYADKWHTSAYHTL